MSWFDKLFARTTNPPVVDEAAGFVPAPAVHSGARHADNLPAFRQAANAMASRGGRADAADARGLIRDAFTPSQPVSDREMFAGRRALLQDLIVAVEDQKLHFVLYGDRGIGKTSVLRVLRDLAEDAGYVVCYISCGEGLNFTEFARRVAQRIPLLMHSDFAPGSHEIEQGLHLFDILGDGAISVSSFGDHLSKLTDTRMLIVLDEFDRVQDEDFRRTIAALIKMLSDNAARVQLVIAGVASDLSELIAQIPSIRRNVIGVSVPNMTDAEAAEMLNLAEGRSGMTFSEEARELLFLAALGLPYLVGLLGQHAALVAADRQETTIGKPDVRTAIVKARSELSGRIGARTLRAIADALEKDQLIELGKMAHHALRSGGVLPEEIIPQALVDNKAGLGESADLLEPITGDPLERWRFVDDGASIYIWLSALTAQ